MIYIMPTTGKNQDTFAGSINKHTYGSAKIFIALILLVG